MRLIAFLALIALAWAAREIPVKFPVVALEATDNFDVPSWLGAYEVNAPASVTWNLPATYQHGGTTGPGEFLLIRNHGPGCITLTPTPPETIQGEASLLIGMGSSAIITSAYNNWVVNFQGDFGVAQCQN